MRSVKHFILYPRDIIISLILKLKYWFPDKIYLKLLFRLKVGYKLNLNEPKTFNEKLNWLKINYHSPLLTTMADKFLVKDYVRKLIGEEYVVECYGSWSRFEDIDFDKLPNQFVLKTNHDSSGATICRQKKTINKDLLEIKFDSLLKRNWFWNYREWPYRNIEPKIIAEKLLSDGTGSELRDYKFWCFNGIPTYMYCTNKGENICENFYDMDFHPVDISHGFPCLNQVIHKPQNFDLMKNLAKTLSRGIPFVRIDFYEVQGRVFFGEFTFYDWGGMKPFDKKETDEYLGSLIHLDK